ncbi:GtrA family protein [Vibrio fluvialis]|uniref:GtrA family protein n=1 Tax=Vibrio fluvialis TaxID=676 RepID=UPI002066223A|nr:GtrA-like protein [Vibrio fluvialis]
MNGGNKFLLIDLYRFILAGGINTIFTILIYQILIMYISPSIAYALSWCAGFTFLICFYPSKVFKGSSGNLKGKVLCGIAYLVVFLVSIFIVHYFESLNLYPQLIVFVAILFSSVMNFILMSLIFRVFLL